MSNTQQDRMINLQGEELVPHLTGALFWPRRSVLVFSDLHLEKGSSFGRRGLHLPPYDTRETIRRMEQAIDEFTPEIVIALGDSFHDETASARIEGEDFDRLKGMVDHTRWIWILGNHDPLPPQGLGGECHETFDLDPLRFIHEPTPLPVPGEVAGHLHPAASLLARGRTLRRRCFAASDLRLIMPAFGAYTGGLDVWDKAYDDVFSGEFRVWLMGDKTIRKVEGRNLKGARKSR